MNDDKSLIFAIIIWLALGFAIYKGSYWLFHDREWQYGLTSLWGVGGWFLTDFWRNLYDHLFTQKKPEDDDF